MKNIIRKNSLSSDGFSLMEVMVAMAIFASFVTAFITAQSYLILDSKNMRENIKLRHLAQSKLNEIIINPPALTKSLTLAPESKKFEDNEMFKYTITYQTFEIPTLSQIKAKPEGNSNETNPYEEKIYKNLKDNMEKLLWQVEVKVENSDSGNTYLLSTWLYNHEAEVKIDAF